jgi:excinuclease ABC subunit C
VPTNLKLTRAKIDQTQKDLLEELISKKLYIRNSFDQNQSEISSLLEQGQQNALVYLQRNRLGQSLNLFEENNLFTTIVELQKRLGLQKVPRKIECYDISHLSGKFVYGSMVTFIDGKPAKKFYKLFKCKDQNNDFENHKEVLKRRFERVLGEAENTVEKINLKKTGWELPDLIIVDGGKGQLSADLEIVENYQKIFKEKNLSFAVELCALAKREEEVFLPYRSNSIILENQTKFLVQRIRDEAHRFAITNNRNSRLKTAAKSQLDDVAGIGPKNKQKLLEVFGSVQNLTDNLFNNSELVYEVVGKSATTKLKKHFGVINS